MPREASLLASTEGAAYPPDDVLFGSTRAMQTVRGKVEKLAATTVPILIRGEGGVLSSGIIDSGALALAGFLGTGAAVAAEASDAAACCAG